ncbi:hypothetical protein [Streptomyces botrytidirepellens]|uniref:Uncharacterized protein n=1 Tax=Streptomyces botrytidirepellens TaxID=2486417 RepID=A0A3M8WWP0_9ACTN|nr:hypothetical protein [Streptomyces botrytidirepellens]RNG33509.1 hypothetical protein EEJ42_07325 [Streptomyces botrytidirepellens]
MMDFDDPFTSDEAPDYAEIRATYTTRLGELVSAAEQEHAAQCTVPGAHAEPLVFTVDHEFIARIFVPVAVVRDLAAKHTHPGAPGEQITVDSGELIKLECGERYIFLKEGDRVISREEWDALVVQRAQRGI